MLQRNFTDAEAAAYRAAEPFPHIVLDCLWDEAMLETARQEVLGLREWSGEKNFYGASGKKWLDEEAKMPPTVSSLIGFTSEPSFVRQLEELTGEEGLIPDPSLIGGGGVHSIGKGGFLRMHADYMWHDGLQLYRRLNLLIYLNRDWKEEWGGDLKLGEIRNGEVEIAASHFPHFNRTILFTTDDNSMHGHPDPLTCPDDVRRNSIALYYYVAEQPDGVSGSTKTAYRQAKGERGLGISPLAKIKAMFGA